MKKDLEKAKKAYRQKYSDSIKERYNNQGNQGNQVNQVNQVNQIEIVNISICLVSKVGHDMDKYVKAKEARNAAEKAYIDFLKAKRWFDTTIKKIDDYNSQLALAERMKKEIASEIGCLCPDNSNVNDIHIKLAFLSQLLNSLKQNAGEFEGNKTILKVAGDMVKYTSELFKVKNNTATIMENELYS